MKTTPATSLAAATLVIAGLASAQPPGPTTIYAFDTVTALEMHGERPVVTGLAKDTLAPLSVSFVDITNVSFQYVVNRCLPLFITAFEKPGRYFLYLTIDPAQFNVQLKSCRLELKP